MDGWVTIGTKLDTTQLEKDLKNAKHRLIKFEEEAEKLQDEKIIIEADLSDYQKEIEELHKSYDEYLKEAQTEEQVVNVLAMEDNELQKINEKYTEQVTKLDEVNNKIQENAYNQQLVKNEIEQTTDKLNQTQGFEKMESAIKNVGNELKKNIKKVIRWGLALLGIRTVLSLLTRSFSTLMQYNDDLKNKVESMRLMLAVAFEPIINWIVAMAQKLLSIISTILKAFFGIDIYARAMELYSKNTNKGLGGASKSAKELKKQLAGFDEMNILQEPTDSSGGGSGGFKFEAPPEMPVPEWLQWVIDNGDVVSGIIGGITGALLALKLGLDPLTGMGIGIALAGVVNLIIDIIDFLKDPSWEKFKSLIDDFLIDIGLIVIGIGLITNPWVALVGLIMVGVGLIIRYWDDIKDALGKLWEWLKGIFGKAWELAKFIAESIYNSIKNGITSVWNFIKNIVSTINNFVINVIARIIQHFINLWNKVIDGAKSCWEWIKNIFGNITNFFAGIISKIISFFSSVGQKVGDAIGKAFKNAINGVLKAVETILNAPIRAINGLIGIINKLPGVNLGKLSTFSLPRLAKGGIINQPGRGVMVGSAIGGESGREGVIPLTDAQQMALLGEAIGKYITINANITNTMNGRVISRELQKIQDASDFAYNR